MDLNDNMSARDSIVEPTVYLYSIPADHVVFRSKIKNWRQQDQVHKAVMSLFDPNLTGEIKKKRSSSGILYRLELERNRVLVQSLNPILDEFLNTKEIETKNKILSTTLNNLFSSFMEGTRIEFTVDVNAVKTRARTDNRLFVPKEELADFLLYSEGERRSGLFATFLSEIALSKTETSLRYIQDSQPKNTSAGGSQKMKPRPLYIGSISGEATISDPQGIRNALINGVGRSRAYGCGLLMVNPLK